MGIKQHAYVLSQVLVSYEAGLVAQLAKAGQGKVLAIACWCWQGVEMAGGV